MSDVLIRFDRKVQAFLGLLLLLFALATVFELHGSSIGVWSHGFAEFAPDDGVLWGTPRRSRSDEWLYTTPAIVSQATAHPAFPRHNAAWGSADAPLISNLPVRHWSMLVRPQFWGFFLLDLERGFAFYWNMKALLLLAGMFLLLMALTQNDFGVSLLGTAWVFFSGFVQWWYSSPGRLPETIGLVALLLVAAQYLVLSSRRWVIAAGALVFTLCLLDSVLSLHPPFQLPLFHLGIAILVGSLGPRLAAARVDRGFRLGCAVLALSVAAVALVFFYRDARPTIDLMRDTVYPGSRIALGGEIGLARIFGGFYGAFMSEESHPPAWGNVCEASNFILLFPIPMAVLLWQAWRRQRASLLEWSLIAYLAVVLTWLALGWPRALAVASGFGLSPGPRPLLGVGLANVLLCCVYLAKRPSELPARLGARFLAAASLLALFVAFGVVFGRATEGFATGGQVALVSLVGAGAGYLLLARKRTAFAICLLVPSVWSHGLVNPVSAGLGPILDTRIFREVSRIVERDPEARWTVYRAFFTPDFLKAAGAQVFNGTKITPPLEDLRTLDPRSTASSTYNRFAHVWLASTKGPGVAFEIHREDLYVIKISPMNDLWRRLGIRYVAFPYAVTNPDFLAMTSLVLELPESRLWVYEYRWSPASQEPAQDPRGYSQRSAWMGSRREAW